MNANALDWVPYAEEDYAVAVAFNKPRRGSKAPLNSICFHCQQCLERYLKGGLETAGLPIPKTHDLVVLLDQVLSLRPLWASFQSSLAGVKDYTADFLYPGHRAMPTQAREVLKICRSIRKEIRPAFGLSVK